MKPKKLAQMAVESLEKHKANDIRILKVDDLTILADYFIIASGSSSTMVKSLADYVEKDIIDQGVQPLNKEGYNAHRWILLDFGSVIVHIFIEEARNFYDLERLWQDGTEINIDDFINRED